MKKRYTFQQRIITVFTSLLAASIDIAFAYLIIDSALGYTLTWPIVLIAIWITDTAIKGDVRKELWGI